jgi:hypothetical protein
LAKGREKEMVKETAMGTDKVMEKVVGVVVVKTRDYERATKTQTGICHCP